MSYHLELCCARPVSHVSSKDLLVGMDYSRLDAVATEWAGITDRAVLDAALANLRIRTGTGSPKSLTLYRRPEDWGGSQILLHSDPTTVERWRTTSLERLDGAEGPNLGLIRERLQRTVETASVRLSWDLIDEGFALAWLAGEYLARVGDALMFVDFTDTWLILDGGVPVPLYQHPHEF